MLYMKFATMGLVVSEEMSFKNVGGRATDTCLYYKLTCEPSAQVSRFSGPEDQGPGNGNWETATRNWHPGSENPELGTRN